MALLLACSSTACPPETCASDFTASVLGDFLGMPALQTRLGSAAESAFSQDPKLLSGWGSILTSCCKRRNVEHRPPLTHSTCLPCLVIQTQRAKQGFLISTHGFVYSHT